MSNDAERAAFEKTSEGWLGHEPPLDKTLVEVYEEAIFFQKECRRDALKRMAYDTRYYPRSPWQHPLYDEDFTRLRPAIVVFSQWSPLGGEKWNQLEVLIQKNGDCLQVSVSAPADFREGSARAVAEGEPSEIVTRLVSAVERESGGKPMMIRKR